MVEIDSYTFLEQLRRMPRRKYVLWSGGKDSTVVLDLARKVLGDDVDVIFSNTGVEFPENIDYVCRVADMWKLNLTTVEPRGDFWAGLETNGVPSFDNWWCMKLLKDEPVDSYLSTIPGEKLKLFGIKATDSPRRERLYSSALDPPNAYPILNWTDEEVLGYLSENDIPVNPCYDFYGTSRCWVCPGNAAIPNYLERLGRRHPEFIDKIREYPELYRTLGGT